MSCDLLWSIGGGLSDKQHLIQLDIGQCNLEECGVCVCVGGGCIV